MKLGTCLLVLHAATSYAAGLTDDLAKLDSIQKSDGPSVQLLTQYDSLIKDYPSDPFLFKLYERLGYLQLFLNKESQTIESFEKSLELNPENGSVKKNLFNLYYKFGLVDRFTQIVEQLRLSPKDTLVKEFQEKFNEIQELISVGDLDGAINLAPHNPDLRSLRIENIINNLSSNRAEQFDNLIDDYLNLIKSSTSSSKMSNYLHNLSQIYTFNNLEIKNSKSLIKKCLQYDMEDRECIKASKFLNKYSLLLEGLSKYSRIFQSWDEKEEDIENSQEIDESEISGLLDSLKSKDKFIKIRRINDNYKTNLDFINQLSMEFNDHFKIPKNTIELTVLKLELLHSLITKNSKSFNQYSKELLKADHTQETSLPILLHKIDTAFRQSDFAQAQHLINSATKNMRKSKLFKPRLEKLQAHLNQQQRQRQQQQQQYHQRQRQQQSQAQGPPKNDYYKILNIPKTATQQEIKKAYREMTKQYHPDKYKGELSKEEIEHKMTQINHAYEVLSDEKTRKDYDQFGDDPNDTDRLNTGGAARGGFKQGGGNPFGGFGGGFGQGGFQFGGQGGGFQFGNVKYRKGPKRS